MAFTRTWDNAVPAGSVAANTLDTVLQNFRVDVQERVESFFTDIDVDPLAEITPPGATLPTSIPCCQFGIIGGASTVLFETNAAYVYPAATGATVTLYVPLSLPVGTTLATVEALVYAVVAPALASIELVKINSASPPVSSSLGTATDVDGGYQTLTLSALAEVIAVDFSYVLIVVLTADGATADSARFSSVKLS